MKGLSTRMKGFQKGISIAGIIQCLVFVLGILFVTGPVCSVMVEAETPPAEMLLEENLGTLNVGYSKADTKDFQKEIKVRNNGEGPITINGSDLTIYGSANAFRLVKSKEGETVTISPGQELTVGTIRPAHEMGKGRYDTDLYIVYRDEEDNPEELSVQTGFTVIGSGVSMAVTTDNENDYDCFFDDQVAGHVSQQEFHYTVFNDGQSDFVLDISSDNDIFAAKYSKEPVKVGESTDVTICLNLEKANSVAQDTDVLGYIVLAARGVEDGESTEIWLTGAISLTDPPHWEESEVSDERGVDDSSSSRSLYVVNGYFLEDSSNYLKVEMLEGKEFFTVSDSISGWGCRIEDKEGLPAGLYTARLRLLYDPSGKGYFDKAQNMGDLTYKMLIRDTSKYNLEAEDIGQLGYLPEGYTQEEADALMKKLVVKNKGSESLNVSPSGIHFDKDYSYNTEAFVLSDGGETTVLKSDESYDGAWVKPAMGLKVGTYRTYICFQDDDGAAAEQRMMVTISVVKKGFVYGYSSYGQKIGESGLDLGYVEVGAKNIIRKQIIIGNEGTVPFTVTVHMSDSANGVFGYSRDYYSDPSTEDISVVVEPDDPKVFYILCDAEKISETPGKYQGMFTLKFTSNEDETDTKTHDIPLTVEVSENVKVTLDLQGKGGDECQNVTMEFKKGSSYASALPKLIAKATGQSGTTSTVDWPTDDDYAVFAFTEKKDLTDWEDAKAAQAEMKSKLITGDTTIYAHWAKKLGDINLTVEAPEDGEEIGVPVVTVPEGAHCTVNKDPKRTYWYKNEGEETFKGETDYMARIRLEPEFGYAFPTSGNFTVKINKLKATVMSALSTMDYLEIRGSVKSGKHSYGSFQPAGEKVHKKICTKCKHQIKEAHKFDQGVVTKKASCEEEGEKTYTCSECGYEKYEAIPPAGHRYKKTIERMATDEEHGLAKYICIDCDNILEEEFFYSCKDAAGTWYKNSEDAFSATFERTPYMDAGVKEDKNSFTGIKIDEEEVSAEEYEAAISNEITTVITIPAGRMKGLGVGEHKLTCLYKDGEAIFRFKVEEKKEEKEDTPGGKDTTPGGKDNKPGSKDNTTAAKDNTTKTRNNPMTVKVKPVTVKYSKLKKKTQKIKAKKVFVVKKAKGKVTYKVIAYDKKAKKKIKVTSKGKVIVKKNLKKGTYRLKVRISAKGNQQYKAGRKDVKLKVRVR